MRPPRFTERLLDSFIESSELSEDMLGDLSEEWHERAEREGPSAASWWYRRQAAKSAAHLLRSGRRRAPTPALVGAALVAGSLVLLCTAWAGSMTAIADLGLSMLGNGSDGVGETLPLTATAPAVWAARALIAAFACGFVGGLILAWFARRAAMVQVTLLAALWIPCALALQAFVPDAWPAWYGLTLPAVLALATLVGGASGIVLRRPGRLPPQDRGPRASGRGLRPATQRSRPGQGLWRD
jgi:hypothetical protein